MINLAEHAWPKWMADLVKAIYEGLPENEAPQLADLIESSVPVGVDLESVKHVVGIKRMDRLINQQEENIGYINKEKTLSALRAVRQCHESELKSEACDWGAALAAAEASESAWSAALAESAAWKAERDALLEAVKGLEEESNEIF